jgi:hypothetical protein
MMTGIKGFASAPVTITANSVFMYSPLSNAANPIRRKSGDGDELT